MKKVKTDANGNPDKDNPFGALVKEHGGQSYYIDKNGKDLMIGFNPKFLIDALRVIDDEEIDVYLVNPKAPCFIKDAEESYIYLILPVNFTTVN